MVRALLPAGLAAVLSACGEAQEATPPVVATDSAGVRIVANFRSMWEGAPTQRGWRISEAPTRVMGLELLQVSGVAPLPSGKVSVASGGLNELWVFGRGDSVGEVVGGPGDGPGEFRRLGGVFPCGEGTLVADDFDRIHVFAPDGGHLRTEELRRLVGDGVRRVLGVSADCSDVLLRTGPFVAPAPGRTTRMPISLAWSTPPGVRDTLVVDANGWQVTSLNGRDAPFVVWGRDTYAGTNGRVTVVAGSDFPEYKVFQDRRLSMIVRWSPEPQRVEAADRDHYSALRDRLVDEFPPLSEFLLELGEYPDIPETKPVFAGVLVDDENRVWLRRYPAFVAGRPDVFDYTGSSFAHVLRQALSEQENWTVFEADGRWLGSVSLPPNFSLKVVRNGEAIGVQYEALGVERVVAYQVSQGPPGR